MFFWTCVTSRLSRNLEISLRKYESYSHASGSLVLLGSSLSCPDMNRIDTHFTEPRSCGMAISATCMISRSGHGDLLGQERIGIGWSFQLKDTRLSAIAFNIKRSKWSGANKGILKWYVYVARYESQTLTDCADYVNDAKKPEEMLTTHFGRRSICQLVF
jgi:hypothetical protein